MRVKVDLGSSTSVPGRIDRAADRCLKLTGHTMQATIGRLSRSSRIAAGTQATFGGSSAVILVGVGVPFARIRDQGGTIRPRQAQILRFADGGFRPSSRQVGIHYMQQADRLSGSVAQAAYRKAFTRI